MTGKTERRMAIDCQEKSPGWTDCFSRTLGWSELWCLRRSSRQSELLQQFRRCSFDCNISMGLSRRSLSLKLFDLVNGEIHSELKRVNTFTKIFTLRQNDFWFFTVKKNAEFMKRAILNSYFQYLLSIKK